MDIQSEKMLEFKPFGKISRLSREIVVTEKIDGTNAQIFIGEAGEFMVGSRTRWITPGKNTDNYGFAAWAYANKDDLLLLGPGTHYGEWWGQGIQRGYNQSEKHFSLFNVSRWSDPAIRPKCCRVVPILYSGLFDTNQIEEQLNTLMVYGSLAAERFERPEGIVIYHTASGTLYKKTLENDESPKSQVK